LALKIPKSNFRFIENDFSDIIMEIRDGAQGLPNSARTIRKTIVFTDLSKMYCVEEIDRNGVFIELYWYDWYDAQKEVVMKFHAHYHPDETPASITMYDPFHIHSTDERRLRNDKFQELYTILEFIRLRNISIKL